MPILHGLGDPGAAEDNLALRAAGHLRLVFRNLDSLRSDSLRAAQMAAALGNQDHLWQFVELAYHHHQGDENSGYVTHSYLRSIAQAILGVDVTRATRKHATAAVKEQRSQTASLASQLKLAATLSFLLSVNDRAPRIPSPSSLASRALTSPLQKLLTANDG